MKTVFGWIALTLCLLLCGPLRAAAESVRGPAGGSAVGQGALTDPADARPGDILIFGHWEQNADTSDGAEPIEWLVLDVREGRALAVSCQGLDALQYHKRLVEVAWEDCSLRAWLNAEFAPEAFTAAEAEAVQSTLVDGSTWDRVFLLSRAEAEKYFDTEEARQCVPTAWALEEGATASTRCRPDGSPTVWWWLRTPSAPEEGADDVGADGGFSQDGVVNTDVCVRPALWVDLARLASAGEEAPQPTAVETPTDTGNSKSTAWEENLRADPGPSAAAKLVQLTPEPTAVPTPSPTPAPPELRAGTTVTFGRWEQDDDTSDGMEPIEWLVLTSREGRALLVSRFGLDAQPYHSSASAITWEDCVLRSWLNYTFLNGAFTDEERGALVPTVVDNSPAQGNSRWQTDGGRDTRDTVFLLSYTEVHTYFADDDARRCAPTDYALSRGARTGEYKVSGRAAGWWWLRSPGNEQSDAAAVYLDGTPGANHAHYTSAMVRPALWVEISKLDE